MIDDSNGKAALAFPTIHLNGTSANELLRVNMDVLNALREAFWKLQEAAPNMRDYYVVKGAWEIANGQHSQRILTLTRTIAEVEAIVESILLSQQEVRG